MTESRTIHAPARGSHIGRVLVIAGHAFTQLVRMKVFYFLAVFAVIAIASNFIDLPQHAGPESMGASVISQIKSWSIGTMTLFSVVISIVATALLLPKDIEDRTLYTILAKPVPRFDYLAGKLAGVLFLVFISLVLMDLLMIGVLHMRVSQVLVQTEVMGKAMEWTPQSIESAKNEVLASGVTWSLQGAVLAVFLRAAIIAAVALLVSTFSTSTLFTTVIGFLVYFIGNFQADAREFYLHSGEAGEGMLARLGALVISLVLPDFQIFNVIDAVIEGQAMTWDAVGKLGFVAGYYVVVFTILSWFIFSDKEF